MSNPELPDPDITIHPDGTPISGVSDDVYFSKVDGVAETRHVFLAGIGAPEVWRDKPRFRIAELGFGTGLNFLVTWKDWSATAAPNAVLEYVAVEGYPIDSEKLREILKMVPEFSSYAEALLSQWPPLIEGIHRLSFDKGRVRLTLLFGDVSSILGSITGDIDAWFLDGFAPAKNPDMWSDKVMGRIAERSTTGARVATFSVAGAVRRGLGAAGFRVAKREGYAMKRECLAGVFDAHNRTHARLKKGGHVGIIGAGIAGGCLARALVARGLSVSIIDQAATPGNGASGNPVALLAPRLPRTRSPIGRMMASAYLYAVRYYDALAAEGAPVWSDCRGSFAMARNDDEAERQHRAIAAFGLPEHVMRLVDAAEASELSGIPVPNGGLWFSEAGGLTPPVITDFLVKDAVYIQSNVSGLQLDNDKIKLINQKGAEIGLFDGIVVAAGAGISDLMPEWQWPLYPNRGQLAYLSELEPSPRIPVTYGGYISPAIDLGEGKRGHVLGATYARRDELPDAEWMSRREADDDEMLENLTVHLPEIKASAVIGGRTARRTTIKGYMPLAGRVKDNVFVLGGLGSRGFLSAPILSELIADQMTGAPLPLQCDIVAALDPLRFKNV